MSLLSILGLGKAAGDAVTQPIEAIGNVFDKLFTSDAERAQAEMVLEKLRQHPLELQVEINKIEAVHPSILVAGWRPFIGWVLGISLGCYYIPQFALAAILWAKSCWAVNAVSPFPIYDISGLSELVIAMLGLAGLRTAEKFGGITK